MNMFEENDKLSIEEGRIELFPIKFDSDDSDDEEIFCSENFINDNVLDWATQSFKRMNKLL